MAQSLNAFFGDLNSSAVSFAQGMPAHELFIILGVAFAVILPAVILGFGFLGFLKVSRVVQRKAAERAMLNDQTPGNKILIGRIVGAAGSKAQRRVMDALEEKLPEFNFGSAFYMGAAPVNIEATDFALSRADFQELDAAFQASGADLIVWGDTNFKSNTTRLCFATPATLRSNSSTGFFPLDIENAPAEWGQDEYLAVAYVAGKRLRPSLGRPADFRADRLQPILKSMGSLLESDIVLNGRARTELEDDYAAGALHVGEALNSAEWLEKSISFRTKSLENMTPGSDPIRWSQAKIDLGRAMCLMCEQKFEPAKLQEAMAHIREGIDNTKSDARMQLAETGFASLQKAEQMLANRRRFSIRWSV